MLKKIATISYLVTSAFADINVDFSEYLSGEKLIDYIVFDKMWTVYENEFTSHNLNKVSVSHRKI